MNTQVAINNFLPSSSPRHGNPNPTFLFLLSSKSSPNNYSRKMILFPQETPAVATREWKSVSLAFTTCRAGYYVKFAIEILAPKLVELRRTSSRSQFSAFFPQFSFCNFPFTLFVDFFSEKWKSYFHDYSRYLFSPILRRVWQLVVQPETAHWASRI